MIQGPAGALVGNITTHHCDRRNGTFGYGVNVAAEHQRQRKGPG